MEGLIQGNMEDCEYSPLQENNQLLLNRSEGLITISYLNLSFLLSFKLLTLLKGFCLLLFAQEGSQSLIFKDAS